jgi:hypothetical protein
MAERSEARTGSRYAASFLGGYSTTDNMGVSCGQGGWLRIGRDTLARQEAEPHLAIVVVDIDIDEADRLPGTEG